MKSGIKARLIWSYLLLIVITVFMFESFILAALRYYYVEGVKQSILDQGTDFSTFYKEEISEEALENQAGVLLHSYDFLINAQVQIINTDGEILADTHINPKTNGEIPEDVSMALSGLTGTYKSSVSGENLLAVSQPLIVNGENVGVIRIVTSMKQIDKVFLQNAIVLVVIGLLVILIAFTISYFLANTITKPLSTITKAAEQMASGKFSIRISKEKNDELGKLADTLNYMAEQVEKHEMLKNEFIASVSHELRTPLTSVKGWAITLQSMSSDQVFQEGLEIISNESERLSLMLGDLLDLSSLASGKVEYNFEHISLELLLKKVVNQLIPRAVRMGINLSMNRIGEIFITGDSNRLKQVFINVVDNALKFTPNGGSINIVAEQNASNVYIYIKDSGPGISADNLQFVKQKFHKGNSKASGTGLGLAICEEIIYAHQGTFEIKSKDGEGTTVEISLPLYEESVL